MGWFSQSRSATRLDDCNNPPLPLHLNSDPQASAFCPRGYFFFLGMVMMQFFVAIAAAFGGTAVAAGAFGSHALRAHLADRALAIFETGIRYQMYHALALLAVGLLLRGTDSPPPTLPIAGGALIAGIVLFSGSLYGLSLSGIKWLGAIAPFGGACFIVGWVCLAIAALKLS